MTSAWLTLIVLFIYCTSVDSPWLHVALQLGALYTTEAGADVRRLLQSLPAIWKIWQIAYLHAAYLLAHWLLLTEISLIVLAYCVLDHRQARVHTPGGNVTLAVSQTLRGPQLQRINLIRLATSLSDAWRLLGVARKDRRQTLRDLRYLFWSHLRSLAVTGFLQVGTLLFFSPWAYAMLLLIQDVFQLLELQVRCIVTRNEKEPLLRKGRSQLSFALVTTCHVLVLGVCAICWHHVKDGLVLVLQMSTISLNANLISLLLDFEPHRLDNHSIDLSSRRDSGFCDVCQRTIFVEREMKFDADEPRYTHHWRHATLRESARQGCRICSTVWKHRSSLSSDFLGRLMFWKPVTSFEANSIRITVISEDCRDGGANEYIASLLALPHANEGDEEVQPRNADHLKTLPISNHTGSQESLAIARSWLENCLLNHGCCRRAQSLLGSRGFKPSRLLQIPDNFEQDPIMLSTVDGCKLKCIRDYMVTNTHKSIRGYLTLSHCWGKAKLLRLTKANLQRFVEVGIALAELPKTFQDAVRITKALGYNHIWIDSLCIIQDSKQDWARESRLMCDIYLNSLCNIQATDAQDSTQGCLYKRDPLLMQLERAPTGYFLSTGTDLVGSHPLEHRAWVFQESFLAPRCLDFGRAQIFWRCARRRASEVFPLGSEAEPHPAKKWRGRFGHSTEPILTVNNLPQLLEVREEDGAGRRWASDPFETPTPVRYERFKLWAGLVENYSQLKLTKPEDRVVAISGVAQAFRPLLGEYACGAWTNHLPEELLWVNRSKSRTVRRDRAPTWSWLSSEGDISYFYCKDAVYNSERLAEFRSLDAKESTGPSGALVLQGAVQLSGVLLKSTWSGSWHSDGEITIDTVNGQRRRLALGPVPVLSIGYGNIVFDDCRESLPPEDVYCVAIAQTRHQVTMGLVLEPVTPGMFRRLGIFYTPRERNDIRQLVESHQPAIFSIA